MPSHGKIEEKKNPVSYPSWLALEGQDSVLEYPVSPDVELELGVPFLALIGTGRRYSSQPVTEI